jgi:hypothetical protein
MYRLLLFVCIFLAKANLPAQQVWTAHRLEEQSVVFDGKLDEACWNLIKPLPYIMFAPNFGQPPTETMVGYLAYDKHYLYFCGHMSASKPEYIRGTTYRRDAFDGTTDYFGLVLDTYNDNENGLAFFTTPTGLRFDATVANDALNDASVSLDWNTFWDVKTHHTDTAWSAEIRIPWSSLRFQDRDGRVLMGMSSWRFMPAKNEVDEFPAIPPDWASMSTWKPSQMQKITFENVYNKLPLYVAPYVLAGYQESNELDDEETAYIHSEEPKIEAGLDVKFGLTSNLTLDLTVNTDFAQVEADDEQVNLTRFSLFFPEKRLFFQERASIFDFQFDNFNRLFYSRRIGINEDGDPVRIYGGARMVGRVGKVDLGFLDLQTAPFGELNTENFFLLRGRRQVFNPNSYAGGIMTHRMDFEGNYNTGMGVDGILRVSGNEYLTVKMAETLVSGLRNQVLSLDPARIHLNWERRQFDKFSYDFTYSRVGRDYDPGMGFELRENVSRIAPRLGYGWTMDEQSKLIRVRVFSESELYVNNSSGVVETGNTALGSYFESKNGWFGIGTATYNHESLTEPFELTDDLDIPVGNYDFVQGRAEITTPFQALYGITLGLSGGGFFDGNLYTVSLSPRWKVSSHFDLDGFYQWAKADFPERGENFASHLARLRVLYMLNTKFSVAAFVQYNSLEEVIVGNLRLRFNPKEGNDLYLVVNEVANRNLQRKVPHLPRNSNAAVVLKYTYTFNW